MRATSQGAIHPGLSFPDSDGFGRGSDSGGFRRIPGPRNWNPPIQHLCQGARVQSALDDVASNICETLAEGDAEGAKERADKLTLVERECQELSGRVLHSSTFQLKLSRFVTETTAKSYHIRP